MTRMAMLVLLLLVSPARSQETPKLPPPNEVKAAFLKLLDRPKVPANVELHDTKELKNGWILEHLSFASEKKANSTVERVPLILLRPARVKAKMPAVLVLHGTGGNMRGMLPFMEELAQRNIIGVAIDARYHGERSGGARGSAAYVAACIEAWRTRPGAAMEHPFFYDTCWDLWRTTDYLCTRSDVDPNRLGMIGFSMGGIETLLAAAVDERIKVAVPAIAVQSFRWSLENDQWQGRARTIQAAHDVVAADLGEPRVNQKVCRALWNKILPGILDKFDCPSMLRLFAGRELLILTGSKDPNCPYAGAKLAIAEAERAFAGAPGHLRIIVEDVGHTVTAAQRRSALDWFERWLWPKDQENDSSR